MRQFKEAEKAEKLARKRAREEAGRLEALAREKVGDTWSVTKNLLHHKIWSRGTNFDEIFGPPGPVFFFLKESICACVKKIMGGPENFGLRGINSVQIFGPGRGGPNLCDRFCVTALLSSHDLQL